MTGTVTVVIPARNAAATLTRQLDALERQTGDLPFRVILVDNGSTDGTGDLARSFPATRFDIVVVEEQRPGINYARNCGIDAAPEGAVLLCDADDEVSPSWVTAMHAALSGSTWAAGVVDYASLNDELTRAQWGAPERSSCDTSEPFVDRTFGGNCGFLKSMWAEVGRFDDRLSGSGDETELFMRAYEAGYRQVWVPEGVIGYRLRPGVRNMSRRRVRQGRNQVRMSRLAGGRVGPPLPGARATVMSLLKLVVVSPTYAYPAARRYEWLAAVSRHIGRLVGHASR
jgi:glycosyltransferase involved in cell wall biosynthesis